MANAKIALHPKHPERVCWGCEKLCAAKDLRCGNGTIRTLHPVELFGEDWTDWELQEIQPMGSSQSSAEERQADSCWKAFGAVTGMNPHS